MLSRLRAGALAAAAVSALALPVAIADPARADIVRQKQMWVLEALHTPEAWNLTHGRGVTVAIIDSGVDPTVSDLTGSVVTGPDLTGVHTPESDPNWGAHGTWMAALIAGHGHGKDGQDGIVGVAPRAKILSIRVITDRTDPGYTAYQDEPPGRGQHELATAIRYAVRHKAKVISMSLGYNSPSLVVRRALQEALAHNVVVVASSGNSGDEQISHGHGHAPYSFPADYPGVIGVAAIGRSGRPAYFSSDNLSVQVAAPGVDVPTQGRGSSYWSVSGTSPACALTAGVAALIKARYPQLTAPQVRRAIIRSASHRPPGGYDDEIGFGTVDAVSALRSAGRLARLDEAAHRTGAKSRTSRRAGATAVTAGFFGQGRSGVPPVPVPPRSRTPLYLLIALAVGCLILVGAAVSRSFLIVAARRTARNSPYADQPFYPDPPGYADPAYREPPHQGTACHELYWDPPQELGGPAR